MELRTHFGADAKIDEPAGGIFLWVTLPEKVDTTRLAEVAAQAGVAINPGAEWMTDTTAGESRLRVCFAHPNEQTIREGVARLAEISHEQFGIPRALRLHTASAFRCMKASTPCSNQTVAQLASQARSYLYGSMFISS